VPPIIRSAAKSPLLPIGHTRPLIALTSRGALPLRVEAVRGGFGAFRLVRRLRARQYGVISVSAAGGGSGGCGKAANMAVTWPFLFRGDGDDQKEGPFHRSGLRRSPGGCPINPFRAFAPGQREAMVAVIFMNRSRRRLLARSAPRAVGSSRGRLLARSAPRAVGSSRGRLLARSASRAVGSSRGRPLAPSAPRVDARVAVAGSIPSRRATHAACAICSLWFFAPLSPLRPLRLLATRAPRSPRPSRFGAAPVFRAA
jgi:hypothetical protein